MRERLQSMVRVSAMLVSMAVLMGVASVASLTSLAGLTSQISFVGTTHANDIQVTNTALAEDSEAGVRVVSFDLSWENSWRVDNLFPDDPHNAINWDAGWVFLKYRTVGGEWKHATLMEDGHDVGMAAGENMGSGALMQVGLVDQGLAWDASENPGVGVMVYRGEAGVGRFAVEGAQLRWNYAADGVSPGDDVAIALFAIEMVYVAPGAFYVGSGGAEDARFVAGVAEGSGNSANTPFLVTESWDGCVSDAEGCLWAAGEAGANSMDEGGMLASGYPTGFSGFYGMKYEVSQQQYVDFLNTLPDAQAQARAYVGGEARNGISYVDLTDGVSLSDGVAGYYTTSTPYVANNYMSWVDGTAYLDWAGLRPMTELEFEKAARGYADPVANEYAWGSTNIYSTGSAANYSDLGEATESVIQGNAVYNGSNPDGPARVGIFAGDGTSREQSGAGYWGMMELSGNVWERCVTVGNEEGRGFAGLHGDGQLSITGAGNVPSWPGFIDSEIVGEDGSGFRGAGYLPDAVNWLALSFRRYAADVNLGRFYDFGIRGARTMPAESIVTLTVQVSGYGTPNVGGTVSPSSGSYATGTQVELTAIPTEDWVFSEWMGDVSADLPDGVFTLDSVITVQLDNDKSLTAEFIIDPNFGRDTETEVVDVVNPTTGVTWMDRNLGASRVATSSTDTDAYGDLYQWGRAADGHQKRISSTTNTLSSTDQPGHGNFINLGWRPPNDWRNPQNDNLWQGADGVNNPCPSDYRLPTQVEWEVERASWSSNNSSGAYSSPLKLPVAGYRDYMSGSQGGVGSYGYYWSSSVDGTDAKRLYISDSNSYGGSFFRANGYSVRCRKEGVSLMIGIEGNGLVDPVGGTFAMGTQVEILASPSEGWIFLEWRGDVAEGESINENPLQITINANKSLIAVFDEDPNIGRDTETKVVEVVNPLTGVTWMDRNLGASQAAMSSTDTEAYGDLYQWGRSADGHEKRTSGITSTRSSGDQPGHGDFITGSTNWRNPENNNLWQGVDGVNNPCPVGYRIPTEAEWNTERQSWGSNNSNGAYGSPLRLPVAGNRDYVDGSLDSVGSFGYYWSSSAGYYSARYLDFDISNAIMVTSYFQANGGSVRCIKIGFSLLIKIAGSGNVEPFGGTYLESTQVEITASADEDWVFSEWVDDTSNELAIDDSILTVTMDGDKSLTALFECMAFNCWPRDTQTEVVEIVNPLTGVIWMDRNLGANQAAMSLTDTEAYGDLYQKGRAADGHEKRTSGITSTRSSSDQPGHGDFITGSSNWRVPENDYLWQSESRLNNPCPEGYRLPTFNEWKAEIESWEINDSLDVFTSPLKLPMAGFRRYSDNSLVSVGSIGYYWSSSRMSVKIQNQNGSFQNSAWANGFSVRCRMNGAFLTIDVDGDGTVNPLEGIYDPGTQVEITATPNEGWVFSEWIGYAPEGTIATDSSITVIMDSDKNLTAVFDSETEVVDVVNPVTGATWMDRNLGASRAATSPTDSLSYGDLYQWGRESDGHEKRTSGTTSTRSSSDQPDHGEFILHSNLYYDWRVPHNDNLWQSVNNPCSEGFRIPTEAEWEAERKSWSSNDAVGAFNSPLKLPMAGIRSNSSGSLNLVGSKGYYWSRSSHSYGLTSSYLYFGANNAGVNDLGYRASGMSVRCYKL